MNPETETTKWYGGNNFRHLIKVKCLNENLSEDALIDRIKFRLNISNRLTAIFNNTFAPTIEEAVVICDVIGCKLDDAIIISDRA